MKREEEEEEKKHNKFMILIFMNIARLRRQETCNKATICCHSYLLITLNKSLNIM